MVSAFILTLALQTASPSATTLAAVERFAVNVDRKWPTDEREPFVTGEVLRLMLDATRAIATDWRLDDRKLRESIDDVEAARAALLRLPRGDRKRPQLAREVLDKGRQMIDRLTDAIGEDDTARATLAALNDSLRKFEDDRPVRQQVDAMKEYFQEAVKVFRTIVDTRPSTSNRLR